MTDKGRSRGEELRQWRAEIDLLRVELAADPHNLVLAKRIWSMVDGTSTPDVRSSKLAIDIFHPAAVMSDDGMAVLVSVLKELHDDLGETPSVDWVAPPLENAIRTYARCQKGAELERADWLLGCIDA